MALDRIKNLEKDSDQDEDEVKMLTEFHHKKIRNIELQRRPGRDSTASNHPRRKRTLRFEDPADGIY